MKTSISLEKLLWAFVSYCANGPDILLYRLGQTLSIEKLVELLGNLAFYSQEDSIKRVISLLDMPLISTHPIDTHESLSTTPTTTCTATAKTSLNTQSPQNTTSPLSNTQSCECQRVSYCTLHRTPSSINEKICLIQEKSHLKKLIRHTLECWIKRMRHLENTLALSPLDLLVSSVSQDTFEEYITHHHRYHLLTPSHELWSSHLNSLALHTTTPPPLCLWVEGNINSLSTLSSTSTSLGIVGSRHASDNGKRYAWDLAQYATLHNIPVISGGAWGIDAAAHHGALAGAEISQCYPTIAIFAGGLNHKGPQSNTNLFAAILESAGALISELPPETIPHASRFLERNRLIAALSSCICVVEASWRSGALNTARWGYDLLRPVVALPGDIDNSFSAGCNKLIATQKAQLLTSIPDISSYLLPLNNSNSDEPAIKKSKKKVKTEQEKTEQEIRHYYDPLFI